MDKAKFQNLCEQAGIYLGEGNLVGNIASVYVESLHRLCNLAIEQAVRSERTLLRDELAAFAMQGIFTSLDFHNDRIMEDSIARAAYRMADAMLRVREGAGQNNG
jgi:hypothetical protein